jgi:hypothetical protein
MEVTVFYEHCEHIFLDMTIVPPVTQIKSSNSTHEHPNLSLIISYELNNIYHEDNVLLDGLTLKAWLSLPERNIYWRKVTHFFHTVSVLWSITVKNKRNKLSLCEYMLSTWYQNLSKDDSWGTMSFQDVT